MLPGIHHWITNWSPIQVYTEDQVIKDIYQDSSKNVRNITQVKPVSKFRSLLTPWIQGHSPVTSDNSVGEALAGNATWTYSALKIGGVGAINYWFIPAVVGRVSFCVIKPNNFPNGGYIISDNYGGCEYHEVYNSATRETGFLHVYRGDGKLVKYTLAPNWKLTGVMKSSDLTSRLSSTELGQAGSILSVTYINPVSGLDSEFVYVRNSRVVHKWDGTKFDLD